MPIRERGCLDCEAVYQVLEIGKRIIAHEGCVERRGKIRCQRCGSVHFAPKFSADVHAVGLGGEAGVGRCFPYLDRGLGAGPDGRGVLVRDAAHRRKLATHHEVRAPDGTSHYIEREVPLIPLDHTPSESRSSGVWHDAHAKDEALAATQEAAYNEMVAEQEQGPARAEIMKAKEILAADPSLTMGLDAQGGY